MRAFLLVFPRAGLEPPRPLGVHEHPYQNASAERATRLRRVRVASSVVRRRSDRGLLAARRAEACRPEVPPEL